ncbi:MAG: glycosyltransferase family 9 protein [Candidatus Margulisiibacteriota bacterium]
MQSKFNEGRKESNIPTVNVVRDGAKGDVFLVEPVLSQLASQFKVNLSTKNPGIFEGNKHFSVNQNGVFDFTIDLNDCYELTPKEHILNSYINKVEEVLKIKLAFKPPLISFNKNEINLINQLKKDPFVVINIDPHQSYLSTRRVQGINVNQMADYIQTKYNLKVIEVGLNLDYGLSKVTLNNEREAMILIAASSLLIGLDSFLMHIASALQKSAIAFFGSVDPNLRLFSNKNISIIQQKCERQHCYHNSFHYGQYPCELNLSIPKCTISSNEEVFKYIDNHLKNSCDY